MAKLTRKSKGKPRLSMRSETTRAYFYCTEEDFERDKAEAERLGLNASELYRAMRLFYYEYCNKKYLVKYLPDHKRKKL